VTQHSAALTWALDQVGKGEVPRGSNRGKFVQFCQSHTWLKGTGWAWCRAFVLTARVVGGNKPEDGSAGAWDAFKRAKARGHTLTAAQYAHAIPGDEVILKTGAGHACLLRSVTAVGGQLVVNTVDGNWQDKVTLTSHALKDVMGFIHWPEQNIAKAAPAPRAQVVVGAERKPKLVTRKGRVLPLPKVVIHLVRRANGLVYAEPLDRPH
jgi:hypothetical protein